MKVEFPVCCFSTRKLIPGTLRAERDQWACLKKNQEPSCHDVATIIIWFPLGKRHSVQPNAPVITNNFFCKTHSLPNFYKLLFTLLKSLSRDCDPMDWSLPGFTVHGISRQEYWSGLPFPSPFYKLESSNLASEFACMGSEFHSGIKRLAGRRVLAQRQFLDGVEGLGASWEFPSKVALNPSFHVNIRRFIALTRVTSSTRMKSSIPPGKTNLRSRESIGPIEGPAHPLISSQWGSAQL